MGKIATGEEGRPYNKHGFGVFYRGRAPWGIANPGGWWIIAPVSFTLGFDHGAQR